MEVWKDKLLSEVWEKYQFDKKRRVFFFSFEAMAFKLGDVEIIEMMFYGSVTYQKNEDNKALKY